MALPRLVICSALRHPTSGRLITGARHYDAIMHAQIKASGEDGWKGCDQGFIDQRGVYLSRTEAWVVAEAAGQIRRRVGGDTADGGTLYSESLY